MRDACGVQLDADLEKVHRNRVHERLRAKPS